MKLLDESGSNSFGDYMVPLMNLALKQGFGRLIRRASDSGVVAILDERLSSKGYGRQTRQDLPPARFSRDFKDVHKFYQSVLPSSAEFALNVWAWRGRGDPLADEETERAGPIHWRGQLLRLQDGKADTLEGGKATAAPPALTTPTDGECYAALQGLVNLRERIERAGRQARDFAVEVRSRTLETAQPTAALAAQWQTEISRWQQITLITIADEQ
jgi:ATP-dependent DNA helicase DinG